MGDSATPAKILGMGYDATIDAGFIQATHQSVATKPLVLQAGGGNVGIGTTSPSNKLEVSGNIQASGRIVSSATTDADALSAITVDFSSSNMIRVTGSPAACGALNFTNVASGGDFTVTIPNATATCTTIQLNGSTSGVNMSTGYVGGATVSGVVYTAIYDGTTLWVTYVTF